MRRLPFEYWREGPLYWAKFVSGSTRPVQEHWPGLYDHDALEAIDFATGERFAINNNNQEEIAVYLRVIWSLLSEREVLGNAYYWTGDAGDLLKQGGSIVRWQFEVDAEGPPSHVEVKGFTRARSSVQIQPPPSSHDKWMKDKTLLFRIRDRSELVTLLQSVLGDASGEISLFGTSERRAHLITDWLRGESPPEMETLLDSDELFIDLSIGVDIGYNDSIFIASKAPIESRLQPIVEEVERDILDYEKRINAFLNPDDALRLIEKLAGE